MATNYGYDTACVSDVGLVDVVITSAQRVIGERVARRLQTPRGGLSSVDPTPDAANFGLDVRMFTLGRIAATNTAQIANQISAECAKDEEVDGADVTVTAVNGGRMTIIIQLSSTAGPFVLTMNVSQLTVEVVFG